MVRGKSGSQAPWSRTTSDVLEQLGVSKEEGLTEDEVDDRQEQFGPNELHEAEQRRWLEILINQFTSVIILLLAVAGVAAFLLGNVIEGTAVFAVLVINGVIGFVTEIRAVRSMESLQEIGTRVRRAGEDQKFQQKTSSQVTSSSSMPVISSQPTCE